MGSMDFYIDESGNTGDLARTNSGLDFGGQPVFSLAAIGIKDEMELSHQLDALRKRHSVQADELKLSKILKRKPEFALEAVELLAENDFPFFVEVMDKKYQLAVSITDCFIWPPYTTPDDSPDIVLMRNIFAEYIHERVPNDVIYQFIQCMDRPSNAKTGTFFRVLKQCLKGHQNDWASRIYEQAKMSEREFRRCVKERGQQAYRHFLPLPDIGKRGQKVWLLPNFMCFTNIYARINLYLSGQLKQSRIFHDEQKHFDEIIFEAKQQVEKLYVDPAKYQAPYSDYNFTQMAALTFKASPESVGIQLSDIVAGLTMRWHQARIQQDEDSAVLEQAAQLLIERDDARRGVGINMVINHKKAQHIFGADSY